MIYWVAGILLLTLILHYVFKFKKVNRTHSEVKAFLERFLLDGASKYMYNDFINTSISHPKLNKIRKECSTLRIKGPTDNQYIYCNDNGKEKIKEYISQLEQEIFQRKKAADLALQLLNKEISYKKFLEQYPESEDADIQELEYLIEHEPKLGGFGGISFGESKKYKANIRENINRLSN